MSTKDIGVLFGCLGIIALAIAFSAFFAWIIWLIWMSVAVAAFGWPRLSFWQVWALCFALNLIFNRASASKKSES